MTPQQARAAGYLTLEETDERLGAALAARTRGELDRLVADLPPEWRASQERGQRLAAPAPRQHPTLPAEAVWPLLWISFAFSRRHGVGWRPPRW